MYCYRSNHMRIGAHRQEFNNNFELKKLLMKSLREYAKTFDFHSINNDNDRRYIDW